MSNDYSESNGKTSTPLVSSSIPLVSYRVTPKKKSVKKLFNQNNNGLSPLDQSTDESFVTIHNRKCVASYPMRDINIQFPHKAYPCQVSLMSKVIQGLVSGERCLLESPTGTGKTLSLLCATLAWQKKCNEIGNIYCPMKREFILKKELINEEKCTCGELIMKKIDEKKNVNKGNTTNVSLDDSMDCKIIDANESYDNLSHDDDDVIRVVNENYSPQNNKKFKYDDSITILDDSFCNGKSTVTTSAPTSPYFGSLFNGSVISENGDDTTQMNESVVSSDDIGIVLCPLCVKKSNEPKEPKVKTTIYYGTRTHKQISQVVRELKKTAYDTTPMVILSSRERTCIHRDVSKASNKNDRCRDMQRGRKSKVGERCNYYMGSDHINNNYYKFRMTQSTAWDLEDLVNYGHECGACPYYGLRKLQLAAEIVFCPYNYLIDPIVRDAMKITLKNSVVVFDEAHNIEDICRSAASMSITLDDINEVIKHFDDAMSKVQIADSVRDAINSFYQVFEKLRYWITNVSKNFANSADFRSYDEERKEITGLEMAAHFKSVGIHGGNVEHYWNLLKEFDDDSNEENDDTPKFKLSSIVLMHIKSLLFTMEFLYEENMRFVDDYKGVIVKKLGSNGKVRPNFKSKQNKNGFYATQRNEDKDFEESFTVTLNMWCLNPEIAFRSLKAETHSIIVASGTLSPLESFQSELNTEFKHTLQASHIINSSQIFSTILSKGPNGVDLNSSYENTEKIKYQDEVGCVLLQICQTVPHGILVFFTSYSSLWKLKKRWETSGLLKKLQQCKFVFEEPRGSTPEIFDMTMKEYFDTIESYPNKGSLLFAVCRGKVSEGIDFADNQARAVVTIGIPFPNYRDAQVLLKKKYNDTRNEKNDCKLLSGNRWYEIQAFRAINQAFGRCIRHRHDWGAIILIDSRFNNQRYQESLSKWIKQYIQMPPNFSFMHNSLKEFVSDKKYNKSLEF